LASTVTSCRNRNGNRRATKPHTRAGRAGTRDRTAAPPVDVHSVKGVDVCYNATVAPSLVALFGPKRGVRLDLVGAIVIGRASSAALQLIDGKVSREHCRLLV